MATNTTNQPVDVEKSAAVTGKSIDSTSGSDKDGNFVEKLEHAVPGYAMDRNREVAEAIIAEEENPEVHQHVCLVLSKSNVPL